MRHLEVLRWRAAARASFLCSRAAGLLVALACVLSACAPDFIEPWEIAEPRMMGWRVEVEGDPARPRPRLDERFAVRFFLALPSGPWPTPLEGRYDMSLSLCLGLITSTGTVACLGEQPLTPTLTPVSDTELLVSNLSFDLSMLANLGISPDQLTGAGVDPTSPLAQLNQLALIGNFCVDGQSQRLADKLVTRDPLSTLFACAPKPGATYTDKNVFVVQVFFERGLPSDPNRNPTFACDPADAASVCNTGTELAGEPKVPGSFVIAKPKQDGAVAREVLAWPAREPVTLPWDNCAADPTLLQIRAKSGEHVLRARVDPSDRETFSYQLLVNGRPEVRTRREALSLTHALTLRAGALARFESKLDEGDPDSEAEISFRWTPPEKGDELTSIPESGRLVQFSFTLRDARGGVDFTTRELCLLPALRSTK